jgi:hypothetical protein
MYGQGLTRTSGAVATKSAKMAAKVTDELVSKLIFAVQFGKFQSGSFVPGIGSGDKVRALLEPGEFVLNRNAVKAAGASNLEKFNNKYGRFQTGGPVTMQENGSIGVDASALERVVQQFSTVTTGFVNSLSQINELFNGLEITMAASHKVEVIINGAAVLQQLQPSIQNLIVSETNKAINNFISQRLPDLQPMD